MSCSASSRAKGAARSEGAGVGVGANVSGTEGMEIPRPSALEAGSIDRVWIRREDGQVEDEETARERSSLRAR